jgi:hypothetical protein
LHEHAAIGGGFPKVTDFLTAHKSWFTFSKSFSRAGVAMPA